MEFRDLKTQYELHKKEIDDAISEVLTNTNFISGRQVQELENELAEYVGVRHCITCANGTDALQLALMTWGIGSGDAVFVPDFTFFASAEVIALQGAVPVFVDIDPRTFNMSVDSLEDAIIKTTEHSDLVPKAIIAVDLFGQPADHIRIREIARKYGLLVLEDGAQGFGGSIAGKRACSWGDISTTSFFPAKPLGCYGDGGAVFTDNDEWAELIRSYRVHGKGTDKYDNVRVGLNSRLDTLQAAILKVKLAIFRNSELAAVNEVADRYTRRLHGTVVTPTVKETYYSSWAQYSILCHDSDERQDIQNSLKARGIPAMIYYRKPLHDQGAFAGLEHTTPVGLDNTSDVCSRVLSLPMHPYMKKDDTDLISEVIEETIKRS